MDLLNEKVGKIFKTYNTVKGTKPQVEVISNSNSTDDSSEKIPLYSNRFKTIEKKYLFFKDLVIGSGSFGKVFYGIDINQKKEYAIKFEKSDLKNSVLNEELKIYSDLQGGEGIPKIHWSGRFNNNKVFIMDLLGPSLDKFYKISKTKTLNLETTVNFGQQMVKRIQYMHSKNYLHRDIKPNNFLLGKYNRNFNSNLIYIVDFGLSKEYKDPITKEHYPYKENRRFVGTPRYASVNTHIGIKQSRRDDLESIAYVLIFFLKSELPWQGVKAKTKSEKKEKIKLSKISTDTNQLCENLPPQIFEFLNYTKKLGYYDEPNYIFLLNILETIKIENKFCLNYRFVFWEWNEEFICANSIKKLNTKESKTEYALLEKNFKNLYEGYPIQDFEEFLDYLICFKKVCEDYKLNEDFNINNSRIILNKNYVFDPNGNENDMKNINNVFYSFENNYPAGYNGNNCKTNSNFPGMREYFARSYSKKYDPLLRNTSNFNNAISHPINNNNVIDPTNEISDLNTIKAISNPNANAKFLVGIDRAGYINLIENNRNNYFPSANICFDDLNNRNNNYCGIINNSNNYLNNFSNESNDKNANLSKINHNNEKIKILNPFAVYSNDKKINLDEAKNNNLIINKLNFKIENPYAETSTNNDIFDSNKDNIKINLTSYSREKDFPKSVNPVLNNEKNTDDFFQQFFCKETQIRKESNSKLTNLFLGNKRMNNPSLQTKEGITKEKNYSFLKK